MTVTETSLEAFEKVLPKIGQKQMEVYETLLNSKIPLTNMEIAKFMNWSINRVTGRVLELRILKLVKFAGRRPCRITKNNANVWRAI